MNAILTYTLANDEAFYSSFNDCKLMNFLPLSLSRINTYLQSHGTGLSGLVFERMRLSAIVELIIL